MKKRIAVLFWLISFSFAAVFMAVCVNAQDATGRIVGNITDQSGASIVGAKITVQNTDTGSVQETESDKDGFYQILSLPIGTYTVTVENAGFRKQVFGRQTLQINQSLRLDAKLVIGQTSETVEVTDQVANIETVNQTIGATVTGPAIQQAPLNGRNVLDLAKLQPGVMETNGDSTAAGTFSIAGGRTDSVTFLLDGALNNDLLNNGVVFNPNPDTIAEFRILESNYSAEYGRNGGGVVSVVTKSGSNEFHGSAFEFLRNDALNANTFFNKVDGLPRDVLKRNQYGGTLGGPIRKDKLFFFVGYQGQRLSSSQNGGSTTLYTPDELNGNFSNPQGPVADCSHPDSGVVAFLQANPFFQADPAKAACAIIDPTKFNSVSQKYIAAGLFPTSPTGEGTFQASHTNNNNELTIKTDYQLSQKDKFTVTLGGIRNPQLNPFLFATVPGFADQTQIHSYFGNLAYSHTFTTNLVNELRVFVQRNNILQSKPANSLPSAAELGIGITPDDPTGPPNLLFDNGLSLGFSEQGPTSLVNNTFGFSDTVSLIHGNHNFKIGTGVSAYQNNTVFDFIVNGEFDFNGGTTGNSLADFLLGAPDQFFQAPAAPSNIRSKSTYAFLQDEWRATKRLSINLGIRYEYNSPKLDVEGRSFSIVPGAQSQRFVNAPVGLLFPGDPGAPRGANFPDKNDWAPRVGFAWDPFGNAKTSVRGGFGVFYDILKGEDNLQFNGQPPFFGSAGLFFDPTSVSNSAFPFFADPFATAVNPTPNPFPSHPPPPDINFGAAGFLPFNSSGIVFVVDPHLRTPYTYQYNLSVQHEIAPHTVLEVSYVGSSSHGLTGLIDVNPFVLGTTDHILNLTPGNSSCVDEDGNSTSGADPNAVCSFAGIPEFKNLTKASYNSLQASLTKQVSNTRFLGRTYFTLAYTWAHAIDNVSGFQQRNSQVPSYAPGLFRASSDQDIRNRITFSGGWDLPFDHAWSSGPKRLTQGWSLFPIVTWRSGLPIDVFARLPDRFDPGAEGPSGAGDPFSVHANIVGSTATFDPRKQQTFVNPNDPADVRTGNFYFNPFSLSNAQCGDANHPIATCVPGPGILPANSQVVADPSLATYGTYPRNFLRGPGYVNFDLAFAKTTAINERLKLEFRAEFFNIFNHANFLNPNVINNGDGTFASGAPGTNINSTSGFGQISGTYDPRIIQFGLRLAF